MRKATWIARWNAGGEVARAILPDGAYRIGVRLELDNEPGRPVKLHLSPEDATYLAHRLLFHVDMFDKRDANLKGADNA